MEKTCNKCRASKPLGSFYRNCRAPDGLLQRCKVCQDAATRKIRATEHGAVVQAAANRRSVMRNLSPVYRQTKELNRKMALELLAPYGWTRVPSLSEVERLLTSRRGCLKR